MSSIATNVLANNVLFHLNQNQQAMGSTFGKLSTGLNVNSSADDPAAYAVATNMQTQIAGYDQASQNIQDANNAASVAGGALDSISGALTQINSLVIQASNSLVSPQDLQSIQNQIDSLVSQINNTATNTQFNGTNLLDGTLANGATVQTGPGAGDTTSFSIPSMTATSLGINGLSVQNLTYAVGQTPVPSTIDQPILQNAFDTVLAAQASIGSTTIQLNDEAQNNQVASVNLTASKSTISDLNVAQGLTSASKEEMLNNIGMMMLAQSNINQKAVMNLIQNSPSSF